MREFWWPLARASSVALRYGSIVSVYTGQDACITALTDNGIEELKEMLTWARASETEWRNFLQNFVGDPEIIKRGSQELAAAVPAGRLPCDPRRRLISM